MVVVFDRAACHSNIHIFHDGKCQSFCLNTIHFYGLLILKKTKVWHDEENWTVSAGLTWSWLTAQACYRKRWNHIAFDTETVFSGWRKHDCPRETHLDAEISSTHNSALPLNPRHNKVCEINQKQTPFCLVFIWAKWRNEQTKGPELNRMIHLNTAQTCASTADTLLSNVKTSFFFSAHYWESVFFSKDS